MLNKIQKKLILSPAQARVKYCYDEIKHIKRIVPKFEAEPLLQNCPKISLPLPLPDMSGEWG